MPRRPARNTAARNTPAKPPTLSHDAIAREAFRIYQSRHGAPGDPVADWFEATRIVTGRTTAKSPPRTAQAEASADGNGRRARRRQRR